MNEFGLIARVCAFARAYHYENAEKRIFSDSLAGELLSVEEKKKIAESMVAGIAYFCPGFSGTSEEALKWIVNNRLAPPTLGRSAFAEEAIRREIMLGARQYLIFGAGFDTYAYRHPSENEKPRVFEIDTQEILCDKKKRLHRAGISIQRNLSFLPMEIGKDSVQEILLCCPEFDKKVKTVCSFLGLVYYLSRANFCRLLFDLGSILTSGSALIFDYPLPEDEMKEDKREVSQAALAASANEKMKSAYSYRELESLLSENGFLIYENLTSKEITKRYFEPCHTMKPTEPMMSAFEGVSYCLAVRN